MKKIIMTIFMTFIIFCNSTLFAYASTDSDETPMTGFQRWLAHGTNDFYHVCENIGVIFNPSLWGSGSLHDNFIKHLSEGFLIEDSETVEDYLNAHITVTTDENGDNIAHYDNEIVNVIYDFAIDTIEQETGFTVFKTVDATKYADLNINAFKTQDQYRGFLNFCAENSSNIILCNKLFSNFTKCYDSEGNLANTTALNNGLEVLVIDLATTELYFGVNTSSAVLVNCVNENWEKQIYKSYVIGTDGNIYTCPNRDSDAQLGPLYIEGDYTKFGYKVIRYYSYNEIPYIPEGYNSYVINLALMNQYMITQGGQSIRMYNTLADLKQYTVGNRPYLAGEQFYNYDASVDNSTTITQTTLDNSITYGDVYNYITNNYDNPDSLTEDELRDILSDYLSQNSGNGNNSGNSGNSGGSGLNGLLSGLGSVGDALLAIIGKLLEYVGKAIELLSGTVTKVIDLIPSNITNLFGALFPFVPEEWKVGIELSIALGVIVGIVCIFKK